MPPGHQWFGNPTFKLKRDLTEAKRLLAEAGYGPSKPFVTKILISPSGSGQMQPLPMNEFIQQNLAEAGMKIDFETVEWNTLINIWRAGANHESSRGATGMNYSISSRIRSRGSSAICNATSGRRPARTGVLYCDKEMDALFDAIRNTFDPVEQTKVLQKVHEKYVNDALFLMVTHDVNARAMSPKVKGFVQAQNWFQDFNTITIAP